MVRWREAGRQRARQFADEAAARRFDAQVAPPPRAAVPEHGHGGVYAYEAADGPRRPYVFRQSDGRLASRRGFTTHVVRAEK